MDGAGIDLILSDVLSCTRTHYLGVFALDQIPLTPLHFPCAYVANTDPSTLPGTHWVAFYLDSPTQLTFFDSYGCTPQFYNFALSPDLNSIHSNSYPIQQLHTSVCGQYCIYFLYHRSRCTPLSTIISALRRISNPDNFVQLFVAKLRSKLTSDHHSCFTHQCAKMKE